MSERDDERPSEEDGTGEPGGASESARVEPRQEAPPTSSPADEQPTASVASSTRWSAVSKAGVQIIRIGVLTVATRLLARDDDPRHAAGVLGVIASAMLVRQLLDLLCDFGLGQAVIQRKELREGFLGSVLGVNLAIGAVLSALLVAAAPLVTLWFEGQEQLVPVLRVLSVAFFVSWAGIVHRGVLARGMRFDRLAFADIGGALANGLVAIPLLALGFGVWALVAGMTASACVATGALWFWSPWRHIRPRWAPRELEGSGRFVLNLLGFNLLNFSTVNLDRVIVGHLGSVAMGHYDWALRIVMYPMRTVTATLAGVLTAAFSRLQDEDAILREKYLRAVAAVALITSPLMFGLVVTARPLVLTLIGEDWVPIVPILQIMAPIGLVQSLTYTTGSLYLSKGRSDLLLRWSFVTMPTLAIASSVGSRHGLQGVAIGLCAAYLLLAAPAFAIPFRLIGLRLGVFARRVAPYLTCSAGMLLVAYGVRLGLRAVEAPALVELIATVAAGALAYAALVWTFRLPAVLEYARLAKLDPNRGWLRRFGERRSTNSVGS